MQPPHQPAPYQPQNPQQNPYQQPYQSGPPSYQSNNKVAAGICGILLGGFGIHKFVLGYTQAGVIMLLASLLTCFIAAPIMHVIGLVEGIIYLSKSDADFMQTYVYNKKEWF